MSDEPRALSPRDAVERYLRKRRTDSTERTLKSYAARLERFLEWCEANEIERMGELSPWHVDEYDLARRELDLAPTTIKGHLTTLRIFLEYAESIGAVEEGLSDAVDVPALEAREEKSDQRLDADDATAALSFFRDSPKYFGVPMHAFLEVAWHVGARIGAIRGLDLGDYDADEQWLHFVHRPDSGTPLKNKRETERFVGINEHVCDALDTYIARERSDVRDDEGREPLFAGRQGRSSFTTLRAWSYLGTEPCLWMDCPHGRRRPTCEWTQRSHASKCPSSRSPHAVRTGSITWQLNQGLSIETVATRVGATPATIRRYYDVANQAEEFEERRRQVEQRLDITVNGES